MTVAVDPEDYPKTSLEAALVYASLGIRCIPSSPDTKHPPFEAWQDVATTDAELLTEWFEGLYRNAGISIVTGLGLFVVDIDPGGLESMRACMVANGCDELPPTWVERTPRGGLHYYFACPASVRIKTHSVFLPHVDVRGDGGQVLCAPSQRRDGKGYQWVEGRSPLDLDIAAAPAWLLELVRDDRGHEVLMAVPPRGPATDAPWDHYNGSTTWQQLLEGDGWVLDHTDRERRQHWRRPGKDPRHGTSATVGHGGTDMLYVFTTSIPWLPSGRGYDRWGYYVQRDHAGDFKAAARAHKAPAVTTSSSPTSEGFVDDRYDSLQVDWTGLWDEELAEEDWLIEPLIARGRGHALYAQAKQGKSYVVLQGIVAACVAGRRSWTETPDAPIRVLYLDYEMTRADLRERLELYGYSEADDLSNLHYLMAAGLGADLDSPEGGRSLLEAAQKRGADLVVVDTMARAVTGAENDADTVRAFYANTGALLKSHGIAVLRLDHAGKELDRGQRGTSGKNDDVDIVWELTRTDGGAQLRVTHSRVSWVPSVVELRYEERDDGTSIHVRDDAPAVPAGTSEMIARLEAAKVPADAGWRMARKMGVGGKTAVVTAAQKVRRGRDGRGR